MAASSFFREDGERAVVTAHRVELLIPEAYFEEPPLAEDLGGAVETLCYLDVRAFAAEGSAPQLFSLRLPARLRLRYASAGAPEVDSEGEKLRVFVANEGDVLAESLSVVNSADNVAELFRVLAGARVRGVPYSDLADLFIQGARINRANPGATRAILEALVSDLARWRKDANVPVREALASGRAGEGDYRLVPLKSLPRLNSVFAGLSFEDPTLSVQSAVRKTLAGEPQQPTPLEEIVRY